MSETTGDRRGDVRDGRARRRLEAACGYLALGMPTHAVQELAGVPDGPRFRFDVCRLRGDALRAAGLFAEAEADYARALTERPDALPVVFKRADCQRRMGRLDAAIAGMEQANRLRPDQPAVVYALARFCTLAGERERALDWLARAVSLCPEIGPDAACDADFVPLRFDPRFRRIVTAPLRRAA